VKNSVPHVQPPIEWLERMLAVRLHLDDANECNGALRVLPGTHRQGRVTPQQIEVLRHTQPDVLCAAHAGDAMIMRPLLLHASSQSASGAHRRVIHIEYAAFVLPSGLQWHETA
jgi:ectoine hydroxylase-related dioxygenase (phytanoyl-CoA dioxygenase family)